MKKIVKVWVRLLGLKIKSFVTAPQAQLNKAKFDVSGDNDPNSDIFKVINILNNMHLINNESSVNAHILFDYMCNVMVRRRFLWRNISVDKDIRQLRHFKELMDCLDGKEESDWHRMRRLQMMEGEF